MSEELIKRLREDDTDPVMLKKAADTIEAQAAEIAEHRRHHCTVVEITRPLLDAFETQATAIKRLRGLVEELADDLEVEVRDRWGYDERLAHKLKRDMDVINRARAALGETK